MIGYILGLYNVDIALLKGGGINILLPNQGPEKV